MLKENGCLAMASSLGKRDLKDMGPVGHDGVAAREGDTDGDTSQSKGDGTKRWSCPPSPAL
jgi:hypothetical protein